LAVTDEARVTAAHDSYHAQFGDIEPAPLAGRQTKMLEIVDRVGIARYISLLTLGATVTSLLVSISAYALVGFDPFSEPIAIALPILCPILIAPPMSLAATRLALKLRDQQRHIANQKVLLERTLTEKDRIISLVGHDLKGQLNLVMGFARLIARQGDTMPSERLIDYANEINHAGAKTNDILSDLLNWGRARSGQLSESHDLYPLNDVLDPALNTARPDADRKNITINLVPPIGGDLVDNVIIGSALRNLLNNAIKFSHPRACC
jgi:signal transduction histidine kinase